jgi:hypothetical protein
LGEQCPRMDEVKRAMIEQFTRGMNERSGLIT